MTNQTVVNQTKTNNANIRDVPRVTVVTYVQQQTRAPWGDASKFGTALAHRKLKLR